MHSGFCRYYCNCCFGSFRNHIPGDFAGCYSSHGLFRSCYTHCLTLNRNFYCYNIRNCYNLFLCGQGCGRKHRHILCVGDNGEVRGSTPAGRSNRTVPCNIRNSFCNFLASSRHLPRHIRGKNIPSNRESSRLRCRGDKPNNLASIHKIPFLHSKPSDRRSKRNREPVRKFFLLL